jgi:hypothetical protein
MAAMRHDDDRPRETIVLPADMTGMALFFSEPCIHGYDAEGETFDCPICNPPDGVSETDS